MVYEEVRGVVKSLLTQKGKSESALFGVTGIYSDKSKKQEELQKKLEKKQQELDALRNKGPKHTNVENSTPRGGRGGGRGGRGGSRGGRGGGHEVGLSRGGVSLEMKRGWTCSKYNSSGCSEPCPDGKKHLCSFTQGSYICWEAHPEVNCTRKA